MRTELEVKASDPGGGNRAFPWPVLEAGNGSWPRGVYRMVCTDRNPGTSFLLTHEVRGAPLVNRWMDEGKLEFVCSVAAPRSMYRALRKSDSPRQEVVWRQEDLGEFPMFTPLIVACEEILHVAESDKDGLSGIWDGRELAVPKGARIAIGVTFKFRSGLRGMLDFRLSEDLLPGQFEVSDSAEDGFKFKVDLARDLHEHLRISRGDLAGRNIMTHIVNAALGVLQREWAEDKEGEGWRSYRNLVALASMLEEKGLPCWDDQHFQPEKVATALFPHKVDSEAMEQVE